MARQPKTKRAVEHLSATDTPQRLDFAAKQELVLNMTVFPIYPNLYNPVSRKYLYRHIAQSNLANLSFLAAKVYKILYFAKLLPKYFLLLSAKRV